MHCASQMARTVSSAVAHGSSAGCFNPAPRLAPSSCAVSWYRYRLVSCDFFRHAGVTRLWFAAAPADPGRPSTTSASMNTMTAPAWAVAIGAGQLIPSFETPLMSRDQFYTAAWICSWTPSSFIPIIIPPCTWPSECLSHPVLSF